MIMTRRLAGTVHSSCPKSPNVLPIGHLSNKSSVYSPTSMSHMSQDLVYNHMRSHYQRIASAKACVDTSSPKSMKLMIKERDRKKREHFQTTTKTTPTKPSASGSQSIFQIKENSLDMEGEAGFPSENSIAGHRNVDYIKKLSMNEVRRSSRRRTAGRRSSKHGQNSCMSTEKDSTMTSTFDTTTEPGKNNRDLMAALSLDPLGGTFDIDQYGSTNFKRNNNKTEYVHSLFTGGSFLQNNGNREQDNDLVRRQFDQVHTSTPRFALETDQDEIIRHPTKLQVPNVSFSYKTPPSPRRRNKKSSEEIIWTEEQKYLHFISEVTNDVLARGIFSNRALNRLFESHIERRKDDLDEEHMWEMIKQLKQDLDITDG